MFRVNFNSGLTNNDKLDDFALLHYLSNSKTISKIRLIVGTILLLCHVSASICHGTEIVVNKSASFNQYSLNKARSIFTMRVRYWPNGEKIKVFTLADNHPLHKKFTKNNLHMFPHQLRRVWNRLVFSGTGVAPIELSSEQEMRDKIANTPNSIGYLDSSPENEDIQLFANE